MVRSAVFLAASLIVVAPSPCFALWLIAPVSKELAKKMDMEVRSTAAGPNHVTVELDFSTAGALKDFSRVDLRIGEGDNPPVTAPLREDRSKPGRAVVSFTADRAQLPKLTLWVYVPDLDGGSIYDLRVKDFVAVEGGRNPAQPQVDVEKKMAGLEQELAAATPQGDVALLDRVLAKEYRLTGPDGAVTDREAELRKAKAGNPAYEPIAASDLQVNVYGDAAVLTGRRAYRVGGDEYRFTSTYVWREDRWQCVARQVTSMPKN